MHHIIHTLKNMIWFLNDHPNIKHYITVNAFNLVIYKIIERTTITPENLPNLLLKIDNIKPFDCTNIEYALINSVKNINEIKTLYPTHKINHIFMTDGEATTGSNNIFIGPGVTNGGTAVDNTLLIGSGPSASLIVGDISGNRIGINLSSLTPYTADTRLLVNGFTRIGGITNNGKLGINTNPETFDLDVNGVQRIQDGVGTLTFSNGIQSSSGGFKSLSDVTGVSTTSTIPFFKGMFMLSATSNTTRHGVIGVASSTSNYTVVSQGSNGTLITADGSTLVVASGTVAWTITHFPTP
jgi:hypothetical protein